MQKVQCSTCKRLERHRNGQNSILKWPFLCSEIAAHMVRVVTHCSEIPAGYNWGIKYFVSFYPDCSALEGLSNSDLTHQCKWPERNLIVCTFVSLETLFMTKLLRIKPTHPVCICWLVNYCCSFDGERDVTRALEQLNPTFVTNPLCGLALSIPLLASADCL